MTVNINISPELEARVRDEAARAGVDVETFVMRQIERAVARPRSLEEISGPIARAVAESGMTEDEMSEFLEREKHQMRAERRARQGP